jgi:hypothetical protein
MTSENDWVTQDVVPAREEIDERRFSYAGDHAFGAWGPVGKYSGGAKHGTRMDGDLIEIRCRRKDHPVLGKVGSQIVSQDELNAATKTRAWTFGTPAQTGHFLFSYKDPAIEPQEIFANTISSGYKGSAIWFIYLGQTSDFADPVVPKAKYTLLMAPKEPRAKWLRRPDEIQDRLNAGWRIVIEQECEVPEWDR